MQTYVLFNLRSQLHYNDHHFLLLEDTALPSRTRKRRLLDLLPFQSEALSLSSMAFRPKVSYCPGFQDKELPETSR